MSRRSVSLASPALKITELAPFSVTARLLPVNVTLALLWTRAAAPLSVATFPVPRYNFGAQASGNADKFKGFAEECMAEYDLDG
jgi:hypothetical protein